jgi:hypothetical protein
MKCEDCGKEKPDVKETICPYAEEICEEKIPATLCDDCYGERLMDI